MGYRKVRSSLYIADAATITQAASLSSAASVAQRLTASTSVAIGGASIVQVQSLSASATIGIAGGMVVLASSDATASTYTLPTSTAGTVYYIYFSSGPDSGVPKTNSVGIKVRTAGGANTVFADLLSTAPADGKVNTVKLIGSTGDHFIIVALSSSQWNIVSYSSNAATSSGA